MRPRPDDLGRVLSRVPPPGAADAERRAAVLVADAYARRRPAPRPRAVRGLVLVAAVVAAVAVVAVAVTPPGGAVARWVRAALALNAPPRPRPTLGPLPGAGRLLVSGRGGLWILASDGTRRRLGAYAGAAWSPHGLYVAVWRQGRLAALAPSGRVAWMIGGAGRVADASWAPDGYRIAYRTGRTLHVIAGDGSGLRIADPAISPTAPAWRPGPAHELAWVRADGRAVVRDVDTGRLVWRSAASIGPVRRLAWSTDGTRLLASRGDALWVLDVHGNRVWRIRPGARDAIVSVAWAPAGRRIALVLRDRRTGVRRVVVTARPHRGLRGRVLLVSSAGLAGATWAPDGRHVLVSWRAADEWLFLPAGGRGRVVAVSGLRRRFGGSPAVRGWCCSR